MRHLAYNLIRLFISMVCYFLSLIVSLHKTTYAQLPILHLTHVNDRVLLLASVIRHTDARSVELTI